MTSLGARELKALEGAKESNEHWFSVLVDAAGVMSERRKKYSGKTDPYTNFIIMARALGTRVTGVFNFYKIIKLARSLVDSGDFADESMIDTDLDEGNYAYLSAGWRKRDPKSRLVAMLEVGNWVEVETLEDLGVDLEAIIDG